MRAIDIAIVVISIQIGMGIIAESGLFSGVYFENEITGIDLGENPSIGTDTELLQSSTNFLNRMWNALSWGWIKQYFEPLYSNSTSIHNFIDAIVNFLRTISGIVIGAAFVEFARNRVDVF